jgi:hypothetical protein
VPFQPSSPIRKAPLRRHRITRGWHGAVPSDARYTRAREGNSESPVWTDSLDRYVNLVMDR